MLTLNGFPAEFIPHESDTQQISLPVLDTNGGSVNAICNDFTYTITPVSPSDVDNLLTIDVSTGSLSVLDYSSQETLDLTSSGIYEYTLQVQSDF